ncbi:MAG: hypothetical protein Q8S71_03910 [Hydrogenophaga sp.]|nr:hypothetical protein [Hydrogenophaga sp.]
MNRAQRRQAERNNKRGIVQTERVIPLPALLDEFAVFDLPQCIFDQLKNGQIDAANDVPVFRDNTGELCEVVPALDGWIFTWEKIAQALGIKMLAFTSMRIVLSKLNSGAMLSVINIAAAHCELAQCRAVFRKADRAKLMSVAKTAQIQLILGH